MSPEELRTLPDDAFEAELDARIERASTAMARLLAKWHLATPQDSSRHQSAVNDVTSEDLIRALDEADWALGEAWAEKSRRLTVRQRRQ